MFAPPAVMRVLGSALRPSGRTFDAVLVVRVSEGMKKIARSALRAFGHPADCASPRRQVGELAVELLAGIPAPLQLPPCSGGLPFRVIFDVQIAAQVGLGVAATSEGFYLAKRFQLAYHVLIELAKVLSHFRTLEFKHDIGIVFRRVFLEGEMRIKSRYQDHLAEKDSAVIFGTRISVSGSK